jgi:hypothetical protein
MSVYCVALTALFPGMVLTYLLNDFHIIIIIIAGHTFKISGRHTYWYMVRSKCGYFIRCFVLVLRQYTGCTYVGAQTVPGIVCCFEHQTEFLIATQTVASTRFLLVATLRDFVLDVPQSVGLLWACYHPYAGTST